MVRKQAFAKNVEVIGYNDLKGRPGFQMAMQVVKGRYYLYLSHIKHSGWAVLDVTEPEKPRYIKFVPGPRKKGTTTLKLQVADGLMITSLSGSLPFLHGTTYDDPYDSGVYIWDVKDPENPKRLSYWQTGGGFGVHRFFYNGGRYVHLSATAPGFTGFIYRILDIKDPTHPVEAGRWWMPEQWTAGVINKASFHHGEESALDAPGFHGPPYPKGDMVFCSYGGAGLVILDISNISVPKIVGQLRLHPPFSGALAGARCHTVVPLSKRPLAVVTSEGERFPTFSKEKLQGKAQPMNLIGMVDVADPANPTLIATFPYPEIPKGYPYKNFNEIPGLGAPPFGPHNLHEPHFHPALEDRNDRIYCAYFHAGLRIYDISDKFVPREIAYYIPHDPEGWAWNNTAGDLFPGPNIATAEDVLVDNRGNIFLDTMMEGLYVLRCTV